MAITNATRLSDFGAGIGTQGAIIQVDNSNARLGIGTTNPTAMLSVGPNAAIIMDGIAGVITATSFAGSATGLTGTPSVTVNLVSATDVNVSGSATIDGHLSVAGTITHEDVTNVDSVGIVTGRLGVRVLAGGIQVVGVYTGLLASGIATVADGVRVDNGGLQVVGIYTGLKAGISTFTNDISIHGTAGIGAGTSIKWNASANKLRFNDNTQAEWGDGSDLQIYHDGSTNVVDSASANLEIRHGAEKMIACAQDGQVELWYDNSKKFETTNTGVTITGVTTTTQLAVGPGIIQENLFTEASSATGAGNYDIGTRGVTQYYTANSSGTFTINLRWDGSTALNTKMNVGSSVVFTVYYAQNNASYYMTDFLIDGSSQTEKWAGGSAPSAGGASGVDCYVFNILKTANATFTVMANYVNFA